MARTKHDTGHKSTPIDSTGPSSNPGVQPSGHNPPLKRTTIRTIAIKKGTRTRKIIPREIICINNVYLEMSDLGEKENEVSGEHGDDPSTKEYRRRKLPHWTRSTDDEEAKYADWVFDVHNVSSSNNATTNTTNTSDSSVSYFVHRSLIGLQSEYFEGIFRDPNNNEGGFSETHQKRSAIQLPTPFVTINCFENLLDYLYTGKLALDYDNAIGMVYFGDYYGIIPLKEDAQSFIRKSITSATTYVSMFDDFSSIMTPSNMLANFYHDAKGLAMNDLQEAVVYACTRTPTLLLTDTALSKISDKQFWCRVWAARKHHPQTLLSNRLWSIIVAHFIELNPEKKSFYELTSMNSLPIISANAFITLIEQEHRVNNDEAVNSDDENLTSLQQRWADTIIDYETGEWKVVNHQAYIIGKNIPRSVLESMLLRKEPINYYDFIEVSGAGSECVNGVYNKPRVSYKNPTFTRSGTYKGKSVLFHIVLQNKIGHFSFFILITAPVQRILFQREGYLELPTGIHDVGWVKWEEGSDPSPILQFGC